MLNKHDGPAESLTDVEEEEFWEGTTFQRTFRVCPCAQM